MSQNYMKKNKNTVFSNRTITGPMAAGADVSWSGDRVSANGKCAGPCKVSDEGWIGIAENQDIWRELRENYVHQWSAIG
ncbi:unnamed protein product [Euphydryas editha]|uniref:Uncharacterized protein n=1 Tax=Euphydryas editha TaxID=104508 RepID=A0AAU9TGU6_EUPED|nr:unnamed protein product [Euphydryas editha]